MQEYKQYFGATSLYEVFGITKAASAGDIKKAYYKKALQYHPDRNPGDEEANKRFQLLSQGYEVLADDEKKNVYDETGMLPSDDPLSTDEARDWDQYWRTLYRKVTTEDIENFASKYRGSQEEVQDLKDAYMKFEGDLDSIIDSVILASPQDEPRFRDILLPCIKSKELPRFKAFTKEAKSKAQSRKQRYSEEAKEAEQLAKQLKADSDAGLHALIAQRKQQRSGFLVSMEERYAKKSPTGKGKSPKPSTAEPSEDEFLAMRAKVDARRSRK